MKGTINLSVDDDNNPLGYEDYKDPEYSIEAYLKAYDPKKWGKKEPSGKLEEARLRSKDNQRERVLIRVGSNTTIIGLGDDAKIVGGGLYVKTRKTSLSAISNSKTRTISSLAGIRRMGAAETGIQNMTTC